MIFRRRMIMRLTKLFTIAAVLFLVGCATATTTGYNPPTGDPKFWNSFSYTGQNTEVGHHMSASPRATCVGSWSVQSTQLVRGRLPPGLTLDGTRIEGTPQRPGNWSVTIRYFQPQCNGKVYADKDVPVDFNIKGIAVRKVR